MAAIAGLGPSALAPPTPYDPGAQRDAAAFMRRDHDGNDTLELFVAGPKCAGCIQKIERALTAMPGVIEARLNLSTKRLRVTWAPGELKPHAVTEAVIALGYDVKPFDAERAAQQTDEEGRRLLRCLAVAAFAAMNIMMFSVPIWSGRGEMGEGERTLLHWISALIALPAALYAAQPFFKSAWTALRARHANMDVPISLAVLLTLGVSLSETARHGEHAYFDGVVMLLFFLLIGRYLDHRLREHARGAARDLLALQTAAALRIESDRRISPIPPRLIDIGDRLQLAVGDRAPVDGVIETGASDLDCAMLTGETLPQTASPGTRIFAGAVNLTQPLVMRATATAQESTLAQLARLIEMGEQSRARFVRLADRAAALYVPVVHSLAALTFLGWLIAPALLHMAGWDVSDVGARVAVLNAAAVLIITCPCALGLAVPAVQIVATGRLFKGGVLVKAGNALERLARVDVVVFDKTGTLTLGRPRLKSHLDEAVLERAATLARASRHPFARALVKAVGPGPLQADVRERPGQGVEAGALRLGKRTFAAPDEANAQDDAPELWFTDGENAAVRFVFEDALRPDARRVVAALKQRGIAVELISGDRPAAVEAAARATGIERWTACASPQEKTARVDALRQAGRRPFMVGDGLNDAPALSAAYVSAAPGAALDVSQAASDLVFQGAELMPLVEAIDIARRAHDRALENLRFSAVYNIVAAPLAAVGLLTPLIAALAMSGSSMLVTLNALRLQSERVRP
ncbi:MAG: copper-translocating P-type ATPase [Alphaproteobacteria bacterium]|nr:copper-translocating P-type ATPase [Alphaproteobacteria bacterium]